MTSRTGPKRFDPCLSLIIRQWNEFDPFDCIIYVQAIEIIKKTPLVCLPREITSQSTFFSLWIIVV